jgi:hypothetical protein
MKLSDALVTACSSALSVCAAGFAGYMVAHGPPNAQSDFALVNLAANRVNISRGETSDIIADPITTGTAERNDGKNGDAPLPKGFFARAQRFDYKLQRVAGETAYVRISNGIEAVTVPVQRGALVPGIGFARALEQRGASWVVVTGTLEITEDGISVAR